jgi:hypothetical protein
VRGRRTRRRMKLLEEAEGQKKTQKKNGKHGI